MTETNLRIDPEFHAAILPLSGEEVAQLEANILADGCRDPFVVWDGLLLDGHHRHEICERYGIPYSIVEVNLPDREAALRWIYANQLGRRNLTPDRFRYYLGKLYEEQKKARGRPEKQREQNVPLKTAEALAEKHGVSHMAVKRAAKFAKEVDETPELKEALAKNEPVRRANSLADLAAKIKRIHQNCQCTARP